MHGYRRAPTITLETNAGRWTKSRRWQLPHTYINMLQAQYNEKFPVKKSNIADLQNRLIEGASQLLKAGIDRSVVDEQLERNYEMLNTLRKNNLDKIQTGQLDDIKFDPVEIAETLNQRHSDVSIGEVERQQGIIFTKCGKG